ncbi:hypothetical protein TNCV_4460791 [Trichonephila clavipes]|nr:hypothetical protein TNCV_4460791 [Trichonephila clavipes]
MIASAECMGGPQAPTPQRCSDGHSVYRQCALEGRGSEIQYHPKPWYWMQHQCVGARRNSSPVSSHGVSKLKSDYRDVARRSGIHQ